MTVNKVVYNNKTIIDVSDSSVTPDTLAEGATAYNAAGQKIVGTMKAGGSNNYSLEEIEIGTWIDGSKLYRRVYQLEVTFESDGGDRYVDLLELNDFKNYGYTIDIKHGSFIFEQQTSQYSAHYLTIFQNAPDVLYNSGGATFGGMCLGIIRDYGSRYTYLRLWKSKQASFNSSGLLTFILEYTKTAI